jgi:N-acetylneuraminic acid mutarotase
MNHLLQRSKKMKAKKSKLSFFKTLFLLASIISLTSVSQATGEIWTKKADMPTARMALGTCVVDGKIYAIGGGLRPHDKSSVIEVYDPDTDIWTRKAPMPTPRSGLGVSAVNGKIYAIGGAEQSVGFMEEYDPMTDTWTRKTDMPTARGFLTTSVVNGKIYVIGGSVRTDGPFFSTVEEYDPTTDSWTQKTDMPEPRYLHTAGVVDGKIYVIAGSPRNQTASNAVFEYDSKTDAWTRKADAPAARTWQSPTAGVVDGRIYVMGGGFDPAPDASVVEYDPATDSWTARADMPTPRGLMSITELNGKIYVIGGTVTLFNDVISTVEEYFPNPLIVDFNGDGTVDTREILRLIEHWEQDDPMCDIAPRPSGDGVVDAMDLELLMSYWGQPIDDPLLLSHWALDETEGIFAYDSAGVNDAVVVGSTVWQPSGGQLNGALRLDGIDSYAVTGPVINPADGPFSVFAWINGGAPGQAVLSQLNGANWLVADPDLGCVMTELTPPAVGRFVPEPLISECAITDGQWHRIGFVWDGLNRMLYVDDILVAEDTQANLQGSDSGLYIGCGKTMESGTYWSGLVDDVRIYNRVIKP